ncbi:MAG: GNAT family N-acetyltransferase [Propionibacteriaceae bacterium]|nr:GNAT family N-acetyltransferase [Propionibacteriaceae bacterium]
MEIRIREADAEHAGEEGRVIAALAKEIWTEHYTPLIGADQVAYMLSTVQSPQRIAEDIEQRGYRYWIAEDEETGRPVGYCGAVQEANRLFLSKLYVLNSYRAHGLSRQFLNLLEHWRVAAELPTIQLTVNKTNAGSIAAYEKLGFRTVKAIVTDIGGGFFMDDYVMEWSTPGLDQVATLVLWRHGTTDWNVLHRFQGSNADPPLNAEGQAQVAMSAQHVAVWKPDTIVCSPLVRARQTSAAVESILDAQVDIDDRLKELDVGSWSGLTVNQAMALDPQYAEARHYGLDYRHGVTGETGMEVGARIGAALRECAHDGLTTLVVSHGFALQMGVGNLLGWSYPQSRALRVMANCAMSVLTRSGDRWRLDMWNQRF